MRVSAPKLRIVTLDENEIEMVASCSPSGTNKNYKSNAQRNVKQ